MDLKKLSAVAALIGTAAVWGLSYSEQSKANAFVPPLVFVAVRYLIGTAAVMLPVLFRWHNSKKAPFSDKTLLKGGVLCGICLAGGEILQQFGLLHTSAGKAGFLTALYVIMIPLIGLFAKRKSDWKIWSGAIISIAGSYMLCFSPAGVESFGNTGDFLIILCALFFAFQFIAIAKFAPDADPFQLSAVQFFTTALISAAAALAVGNEWSMSNMLKAAEPVLFCGVAAIGIACTVQVAAQKYLQPATTSIILSMASVFAVIWGILILGEKYSLFNYIGCSLILAAVILVQLPERKKEKHP